MAHFIFVHCEVLSHTTTSISSVDNTETESSLLSVPIMPRLELGGQQEEQETEG